MSLVFLCNRIISVNAIYDEREWNSSMQDRVQAQELVVEHIKSQTLLAHSYAVEDIMRALARHLGQDEEQWALAGLLHDIDYEQTAQTPERHGAAGADMLSMLGFDSELTHAVLAHAVQDEPRETLLDKGLYAADPVSGLLTACAYVVPSRKINDVKLKSVLKKFKSPSFAAGASREQIDTCEGLGINREDFLQLALTAMQKDADRLGL